ncbi:MAG: alpha-galactosidase, partial [Alphaproteobacteria bacterium]
MTDCWRLDDGRQSLVLGLREGGLAEVLYWGARLPDGEDLAALAAAGEADVTGGMLDANPPLSICPESARSFPGQPGMRLRAADDGRPLAPDFRLVEAAEEGPGQVAFLWRDASLGVAYGARFAIDAETHMIEARAWLESERPVLLDWLAAPVFPAPQEAVDMIDFAGRWCGEFQPVRSPWSAGIRLRDNRTGRTGHEHFPALIVPGRGATNTAGNAWAFHYGWSGGHGMVAEELPDGRRQVQFGHAPGTETAPLTRFET